MWVVELLEAPLVQIYLAIVAPLLFLAIVYWVERLRAKRVGSSLTENADVHDTPFYGKTEFQQWTVHHIRDIHREVAALLTVSQTLLTAMTALAQKVLTEMPTRDDVVQVEHDLEAMMDAAFAGVHAKLDEAIAQIAALVAAGQNSFTADETIAILEAVKSHVPMGDVPAPPMPA